MSYKVLALKYRPQTFASVAGQQATLLALQHSLDKKQLHNAYLFTGTRGVGKTSLARILAKSLICAEGISATPCNVCDMCTSVVNGANVDVIEIDAASRTKVEDTRDLLENLPYAPVRAPFKIYIIDEVHMLSNHSFNALLKTLEEPPAHVKFILATTDPQKLPKTILSRCLQFHLRALSEEQIVKQLSEILTSEQISFVPEALPIIAKNANGSMRDALSLLEQVVAFANGDITLDAVRQILGSEIETQTIGLLAKVIANDAMGAINLVRELQELNADFNYVLKTLQTNIHQLALIQVVPALTSSVDSQLAQLVTKVDAVELQLYYQTSLLGVRDLPFAPDIVTGFEMIILRMLAFQPAEINDTVEHTPQITSKPVISTPTVGTKTNVSTAASMPEIAEPVKQPITASSNDWQQICAKLKLSGLSKILAEHCTVGTWTDEQIVLLLHESQKPLLNTKNIEKIEAALKAYLQKAIKLTINLGAQQADTPAAQNARNKELALEQAASALHVDQHIKQLEETFSAKIKDIQLNNE